ncbi:MAG TPA: DUF3558 domain-containing protein [Pseudonocardiaceae bacterium]
MITRSIAPMTLGVVAAAALAGCSSGGDGLAPSGTAATSATSAASSAAPKVTHPLDASKVLETPCSALTTSDLGGISVGAATGQPRQSDYGPGCDWQGTVYGASAGASIGWETIDKKGLSDYYTQKSDAGYWIPTTVSGYPAVFADLNGDYRSTGSCTINVGVSDSLYFLATADSAPDGNTACQRARQAAADVIKNLGGS